MGFVYDRLTGIILFNCQYYIVNKPTLQPHLWDTMSINVTLVLTFYPFYGRVCHGVLLTAAL